MSQKIKTVKKNPQTTSYHQSTAPVIVEASKKRENAYYTDKGVTMYLGWK